MDRVTIVGWSKRARRNGDATFVLNGGGEGTQAVPGGPPSITKGEELEGLPGVTMHGVRSEHRRVEVLRRRRRPRTALLALFSSQVRFLSLSTHSFLQPSTTLK